VLPYAGAETTEDDPRLPNGNGEAAPPSSGALGRSWSSATLTGCILLEALTLLVLVAFCATLVGVSFLRQALLAAPGAATPTVMVLATPESSPTETVTPMPLSPTPASAKPTVTPTIPTVTKPTPSPTATLSPTPRLSRVFLPVVVRAPSP
jgi:hypothetical protein